MNRAILSLAALMLTALLACSPQVAGTNDETLTGTAKILRPDHTPAAGAIVKVFVSGDSSGIPREVAITDSNGLYTIENLRARTYYNVWAELGTLVAFEDSMVSTGGDITLRDDTLSAAVTYRGLVELQPGDDPVGVTVKVLGTDRSAIVAADGSFEVPGMAPGEYTLRVTTTTQGYSAITPSVVVDSTLRCEEPCTTGAVVDTLRPVYTGMDTTTNLVGVFDSITWTVRLTWKRVSDPSLGSYIVSRNDASLGSTTDTVFVDSLYDHQNVTTPVALTYYVDAVDTAYGDTIASYQSGIVWVYPSTAAKLFSIWAPDSAFIGDSISLDIYPYPDTGSWSFSWGRFGTPDEYFSPATGATTWFDLSDSLASEITYVLKAVNPDSATTFYDTATIAMKLGWEQVDVDHYPALKLYPMDAIVKGNTIWTLVYSFVDTGTWISAYTPGVGSGLYPLPFAPGSNIAVSGSTFFLTDRQNVLWHSSDGVNWFPDESHPIGSPAVAFEPTGITLCGTRTQIVAIQAAFDTMPRRRVAVSQDGVAWTAGEEPFAGIYYNELDFLAVDTAGGMGGVFLLPDRTQIARTFDFVNYDYSNSWDFAWDYRFDDTFDYRFVGFLSDQVVGVGGAVQEVVVRFSTNYLGLGRWTTCPSVPLNPESAPLFKSESFLDCVVLNNQLYLITDNGIFRARR